MEWYIRKGVPLNMHHFLNRARETKDWKGNSINQEQILQLLTEKIKTVSIDAVKEDVKRFIQDDEKLKIWSSDYFKDLIQLMKFEK
jgi:hypothetical protein